MTEFDEALLGNGGLTGCSEEFVRAGSGGSLEGSYGGAFIRVEFVALAAKDVLLGDLGGNEGAAICDEAGRGGRDGTGGTGERRAGPDELSFVRDCVGS